MPIVVDAVSPEKFRQWVDEKTALQKAALKEMDANRVWSHTELMARGQRDYQQLCASCHKPGGEGMPPAFPALKGSKIAAGPVTGHIKRVLSGVPGTAMASWAQLNDVQIAAIITYERNTFNSLKETVQPLQVKAAR
jgi:cytochrome c oxidase subunit 2